MYNITNLPSAIDIGYSGEEQFRTIEIDMSAWMERMPDGVPSIIHILPGCDTSDAYIAATTFEDNVLSWTVSASDLGESEGSGLAQVWLEEEQNNTLNKRGMSAIFATLIRRSNADPSPVAPPSQIPWMQQMTAMKTETVNAKSVALGASADAEEAKGAAEQASSDAQVAQAAAEDAQAAAEAAQAAIEDMGVDSETLEAGSSATVTKEVDSETGAVTLLFGIPQGEKGDPGEVGPVAAFTAGTVTTGDAGTDAAATITGTEEAPVLNLTIPKGPKGDPGNGTMLAPAFADTTENAKESFATYNGDLYYLPNGHAEDVSWANTVKKQTSLNDEVIKMNGEMDFLAPRTINIFDPDSPFEAGYGSPSGGLDAETLVPAKDNEQTSAYTLIMKAIPVVGGRTYAFPKDFVGRLSTYNDNISSGKYSRNGYVSNTAMTSKSDCLQWTAGSNATYIAMHIWNPNGVTQADINNFMILEVADASTFTWPTGYVPYKRQLGVEVPVSMIADYDVPGADDALDGRIDSLKNTVDSVIRTRNIFNPAVSLSAGYNSPAGGLNVATLVPATDTAATNCALSMKAIPVTPGKTYAFPADFNGRVSAYNDTITTVSSVDYYSRSIYANKSTNMVAGEGCYLWTAGENIHYIAVSLWESGGVTDAYKNGFMILEVDDAETFVFPTDYVRYGDIVPVASIGDYDVVGKDNAIAQQLTGKVNSNAVNLYDNTVTIEDGYTLDTSADLTNMVPNITAQSGFATAMTLMKVAGGSTLCLSKDFYGYAAMFNPYGGRSVIYDQNAMSYQDNCRQVTVPSTYDYYYIGIAFNTAWYSDYEHFVLAVDLAVMPDEFIPHSTKFVTGVKVLAEDVVGVSAGSKEGEFSYALNDFNEAYAARVQGKQGKNCLTITFKTDSHTDLGSPGLYTDESILNALQTGYVGDYLGQDLIIHGGDLLTFGYTSKTTPIHSLRVYLNRMFKFAKAPFLVAKGNHDDNCYDAKLTTNNYSTSILIMPEEWNAIAMQYAKKFAVCPTEGRANYCYIDNERTKIRVFVLDSEDFDYHVTNGVAELNCGGVSAFSNEQLNFVAKALLFEDKADPSEWAALFVSHRPMDTTTSNGYRVGGGDALIRNVGVMLDIINAYKAGTSCVESGYGGSNQTEINSHYYPYDIDVDYSSKGPGEVICFLYGHTHDCNTSNQVGLNSSAKSYGHRYVGCGSTSFYTLVFNRDTKKINVFFYEGVKADIQLPKTGEIVGLTENDLDEYGDWETSWS